MAKSEKAFDQNIKDILESYSTNTPPDWGFMQQKMDAADSDLEFDQKLNRASKIWNWILNKLTGNIL